MASHSTPSKKRLHCCFGGDLSCAQKVEGFPVMQAECWMSLIRYPTSARCECVFGFHAGNFAFVFFESCPICVSQMHL